MKKFPEFIEEYDGFIAELKEKNLFDLIPSHLLLFHKPIVGEHYFNAKKRIFFIGQDSDKTRADNNLMFDELQGLEKEKEVRNYYDWRETFNFASLEIDNFLHWYYKSKYKFWEFPIRYMNLAFGFGNKCFHSDEVLNNENIQAAYKSFGWANLSPIVFPHIYQQKVDKSYRISDSDYSTIFNLARKYFGNISFLNKYYAPDVIVVLTRHFNEKIFLNDRKYTKEIIDAKNNITKYTVDLDGHEIQLFVTYHPSGMARLHNRCTERLTLEQFVDVIYNQSI